MHVVQEKTTEHITKSANIQMHNTKEITVSEKRQNVVSFKPANTETLSLKQGVISSPSLKSFNILL